MQEFSLQCVPIETPLLLGLNSSAGDTCQWHLIRVIDMSFYFSDVYVLPCSELFIIDWIAFEVNQAGARLPFPAHPFCFLLVMRRAGQTPRRPSRLMG